MKYLVLLLLVGAHVLVNGMSLQSSKKLLTKTGKGNIFIHLDSSEDEEIVEFTSDDVQPTSTEAETDDDKSTSSESSESDEENSEYFVANPVKLKSAFEAAKIVPNRSPSIWRIDKFGNVILSVALTNSSPLSFKAVTKKQDGKFLPIEAVQSEYFGEGNDDNHANGLKYVSKDSGLDDLMSLIEIALTGNVNNENDDSICWCPSLIHKSLFKRGHEARRWHFKVTSSDPKYGKSGHDLAFAHMGINLKKGIYNYSKEEHELNKFDPIHDFMFIKDYQDQCSDVINPLKFKIEELEKLKDLKKNNWGLTRVTEFIDPVTYNQQLQAGNTLNPVKRVNGSVAITSSVSRPGSINRPSSSTMAQRLNPTKVIKKLNTKDTEQFPPLSSSTSSKKNSMNI